MNFSATFFFRFVLFFLFAHPFVDSCVCLQYFHCQRVIAFCSALLCVFVCFFLLETETSESCMRIVSERTMYIYNRAHRFTRVNPTINATVIRFRIRNFALKKKKEERLSFVALVDADTAAAAAANAQKCDTN